MTTGLPSPAARARVTTLASDAERRRAAATPRCTRRPAGCAAVTQVGKSLTLLNTSWASGQAAAYGVDELGERRGDVDDRAVVADGHAADSRTGRGGSRRSRRRRLPRRGRRRSGPTTRGAAGSTIHRKSPSVYGSPDWRSRARCSQARPVRRGRRRRPRRSRATLAPAERRPSIRRAHGVERHLLAERVVVALAATDADRRGGTPSRRTARR